MKNLITTMVVVVSAALPLSAMAEESSTDISKSKLTVSSKNSKVLNAAIGKNATANTGSMTIKNSDIKKSKLTVSSKNKKVLNAAIGKNATANTGSMTIK